MNIACTQWTQLLHAVFNGATVRIEVVGRDEQENTEGRYSQAAHLVCLMQFAFIVSFYSS